MQEPKYKVGYFFLHKSTWEDITIIEVEETSDAEKYLYHCDNGVSYSEYEVDFHSSL